MASLNLNAACSEGNLTRITELLDSSPNISQSELDQALADAAKSGHGDVAGLLLSHGAHITMHAFYDAVRLRSTAIFQQFVNHGWDINSREFGRPALRLVVGDVVCTKWFLEHGADPNLPGERGATPLATAALCKGTAVIELLIAHGAELDPRALYSAINSRRSQGGGRVPIMRCLLDHGMDVNAPSRSWGSPIYLAVRIGIREQVQLLMERGADLTKVVADQTLAETCRSAGRMEIYEMLSG